MVLFKIKLKKINLITKNLIKLINKNLSKNLLKINN